MNYFKTISLLAFLLAANSQAFAQQKEIALPPVKVDSAYDPRIKQSYEIIDDIKSRNVPNRFKAEVRAGLLQTFANSPGSIKLNQYKSLSFIGLDTVTNYYKNWGLELRGYYARNLLFEVESGSPNAEAYQTVLEGGFRYTFVLDETQIDDYVAVKLLYHSTNNNFLMSCSSEEENCSHDLIYMKSYSGIVGGLERSIAVTPKIGIVASLDLNFIQDTKADTNIEYLKDGIGFTVRGQMTYRVDWFGIASRFGGSYWQGGMVNRLSPGAQQDNGRTSHVQTFRAMSLSWIMHY